MRNKAFTLLEMMLVFVVVAIIAITAVRYYSAIRESEKIESLVQQWLSVYNAMNQCIWRGRSLALRTNGYNTASEQTCLSGSSGFDHLISAGNLSGTIDGDTNAYTIEYNPWGETSVNKNTLTEVSMLVYAFNAYGVPQKSCNKIKTSMLTKLPPNSTVTVNGDICIFKFTVQDAPQ
ncbi:MAG: hypothetical protein CMF49_09780 [Legionellales bacterium]|mgnify:CR=1 FL=1|nr:hypothetical protein [Legionellales bacterium]|tara:strand:- start:166 stop:696 length:531 start_codon:yes stop_codon:yes gene_type:complete